MTEPLSRRGDALLQLAHLGRQRRLVADGARHPAEQRRDLGARLHEAEDVVDEEQHVAALALVAEVLGHRQAGQRDAQARARRLVHLAEDERGVGEHARLGHLEPEVVALARPLADAGEHRVALVLARDAADQLLDQHGLAEAGAAEEADLAAAHERRDEVDHLDAGLEDLHRRLQLVERRRVAVDRPALRVRGELLAMVDRVAEHVPEPAERLLADRDGDRRAGVDHVDAARDAVGGVHRDRADTVVAEVLLHLCDQVAFAVRALDLERGVDLGQPVREDGVDHDAANLDDLADVLAVVLVRHVSPGEVVRVRCRGRAARGGPVSLSLAKRRLTRSGFGYAFPSSVSAATRAA